MKLVIALLMLAALAACSKVTVSQGMGSGVTIRHEIPLEDEQATDRTTVSGSLGTGGSTDH